MFTHVKTPMTAEELKSEYKFPEAYAKKRIIALRQICDILSGKDKRKLFIVGPCSADDPYAVVDFSVRLASAAESIKDKIFVVVRVFTSKPRTRGEGYMGLLHTPVVGGSTDISNGLAAMRRLHMDVVRESGLFTADEILYPYAYVYADDILVYATVGARSAEDQLHRFAASGADVPVGIKNPVNGNPSELADSVYAASIPNEFFFRGAQVITSGNDHAHAVLRGFTDNRGNNIQNYGIDEALSVYTEIAARGLRNVSAIIDTGHSNSGKDPVRVPDIVGEITANIKHSENYARFVKGIMVESYLQFGGKRPGESGYGRSITDPCLDFSATERLLYNAAEGLP